MTSNNESDSDKSGRREGYIPSYLPQSIGKGAEDALKGIDKLTSRRGPTLPDTARFSPYLDGRAHSDAILSSASHEIPTFLHVNS